MNDGEIMVTAQGMRNEVLEKLEAGLITEPYANTCLETISEFEARVLYKTQSKWLDKENGLTQLVAVIDAAGEVFSKAAADKGFTTNLSNVPEKLALIHSEVSEALEAHRNGIQTPDAKCPEHTNFVVELADVMIRTMSLASGLGMSLGKAIVAKALYNKSRPHKHGKQY